MNDTNEHSSAQKKFRFNIFLVQAFFLCFAIIILFRAYQLQILGDDKLNRLADTQYKTKLVVHPKRGSIYDRNGNPLAIDILVSSIGIHPGQITDPQKVKEILLKNTHLNAVAIDQKIASSKKFEWVERRIPQEKGNAIEDANLKGIEVFSEYRRYYPNQELAGQVLGAVGYEAKALAGLELTFDKYLRTESSKSDAEKDARGKLFTPLINSDEVYHDLHLTIDRNVQAIAEAELKAGAIKHQVKSGFCIVMDVASGDVLAMANYPTFNPNNYGEFPMETWKNHALLDVYEPGSTFKTMLMSAAIHSGKVKATDKFDTGNGSYTIGKHTIHDHSGNGVIDARRILQVSSNIGITKIAMKIGPKTFYDFIKDLGFGRSTRVGFIGEGSGYLSNYKSWQDIEFSNISFGQGVSVTGIQMATAYSSIANGGIHYQPLLVRRIVDSKDQTVVENLPKNLGNVLSKDQATVLIDMLHGVTQTGGTAPVAHIDGYLSAGKTGTAQKVDPNTHTYAAHDYVSSFIGMAPMKNPKVVVYVVYDTPRAGGYFGGVTAAPVFKNVAQQTLAYYGVAPSEPMPKLASKTTEDSQAKDLVTDASAQQKMGTPDDDMKNLIVPDLRGLSLRKVLQITQTHGIDLSFKGSGTVIHQSPAAGTPLGKKSTWNIELSGDAS